MINTWIEDVDFSADSFDGRIAAPLATRRKLLFRFGAYRHYAHTGTNLLI
jgi:23S rRNA G2069 N7-methylase RlmK/C1962 C5-methylase RlmI